MTAEEFFGQHEKDAANGNDQGKTAKENIRPDFLTTNSEEAEQEGVENSDTNEAVAEASNLENSPLAPSGYYRPDRNRNVKSKGKTAQKGKMKGKLGSVAACGFILVVVIVIAVVVGAGNLMPAAIHERLVEETDTQYADGQMSKVVVLQELFKTGNVPSDVAENLKESQYIVGYEGSGEEDEDGDGFIEANKHPQADEDCAENGACAQLSVKHGDEIIHANEILNKFNNDVEFYRAVNNATYGRAAFYYDDAANDVFEKLGLVVSNDGTIALVDDDDTYDVAEVMGLNRNEYTADDTDIDQFNSKVDKIMGKGSEMNVSNGYATNEKDDEGNITNFTTSSSGNASASGGAAGFIQQVADNNHAGSELAATINAADQLKDAEQVTRQYRSAQLYTLLQQPVSKMKAGDGTEAPIHPAMQLYFKREKSRTVNIDTGEVTETYGSPLESPSMMSVLAGKKVNNNDVKSYSMERVNNLTRNAWQQAYGNTLQVAADGSVGGYTPIDDTLISTGEETSGKITKFEINTQAAPDGEILNKSLPLIEDSMEKNTFSEMKGKTLGEEIVNGAVYLGTLMSKESGGSAGTGAAVEAYMKVNNEIVAMDHEVDRMERSPLDITSKNTFLGSIMYNVAMMSAQNEEMQSLLSGVDTVMGMVGKAVMALVPQGMADENTTMNYLTGYGNCEDENHIGAVASADCVEIMTFDTSTWNAYDNQEFNDYVEANTSYNAATKTRTINPDSELANYIKYSPKRSTPTGTKDGAILDELREKSGNPLDPFELLLFVIGGILPGEGEQTGTVEVDRSSEVAQLLSQSSGGQAVLASFTDMDQDKLAKLAAVDWSKVDEGTVQKLVEEDYNSLDELDQETIAELAKADWDVFGIVSMLSDIWDMIYGWIWSILPWNTWAQDWASGKEFVNNSGGTTSANGDYQSNFKYKWAQRYMALSRAKDMLTSHANDTTAYRDLKYFEGEQSPVAAFIDEYYGKNEQNDAKLADGLTIETTQAN